MLDFIKLEKILKELEKKNLFNKFLSNLLNIEEILLNKIVIRYIIKDGLIIDLFDYNIEKKFIRYFFGINIKEKVENNNEIIINIIDISNYKNKNNENIKICMFNSLFFEKDQERFNIILEKIFDESILKIINKHI